MLKLYQLSEEPRRYWETWEQAPGEYVIHWGELGTRGDSKIARAEIDVERELAQAIDDGFETIADEDHAVLLIEFPVAGMGSNADLEKRHRLEDRMNQTLGWTGLGACDGGSIGSGTMEVCNFVVDFEVARCVIEDDLSGTEFSDYARIYREDV